jgi:phage-related protein
MPDRYRPMAQVGPGTVEIIVTTGDAFRVFYVAQFPEAIYVLHAFQKKTERTSKQDLEIGAKRFGDVLALRQQKERKATQSAKKNTN